MVGVSCPTFSVPRQYHFHRYFSVLVHKDYFQLCLSVVSHFKGALDCLTVLLTLHIFERGFQSCIWSAAGQSDQCLESRPVLRYSPCSSYCASLANPGHFHQFFGSRLYLFQRLPQFSAGLHGQSTEWHFRRRWGWWRYWGVCFSARGGSLMIHVGVVYLYQLVGFRCSQTASSSSCW